MSELIFKAKRSKFILVLMWGLIFIGEAVFGGCSIFGIVLIVKKQYKTFNDPTSQLFGYVFMLSFCLIIFCLILALGIYLTMQSVKQIDVYTSDKMYKKVGNKVKYEIKYSNIVSIKESYFNLLLFFCNESFITEGTRKGLKTFMEYYTRKDIKIIVKLISDYQNKTRAAINGGKGNNR